MDSGNSGSLQSSSGGDDEFDSRCGADDSSPLSALLRQPPPPLPSPSVAGYGGSFYGLQEPGTTPPPPLSHWSTTPLPPSASASPPRSSSFHGVAASADQTTAGAAPPAAAAPPRGSRKRARASRRAPTTVLTTDTSNFRAMVQEFTGIPSPPFAGALSARSRFDHIFPSRSAAATPTALPPYLLRPFAQKLNAPHYPPFTSPSAPSPAPASIAIAASTAAPPSTTAVASSDGYQLASSLPALVGMQDHINSNYLPFPRSQHEGDARYPAYTMFDAAAAPPAPRLQYPANFLGLTQGIMNSEGTRGGDELSGLVGGASVTRTGGCKATYSSGAGSAGRAAPLPESNAQGTSAGVAAAATTTAAVAATAAVRTQGADAWICTSE